MRTKGGLAEGHEGVSRGEGVPMEVTKGGFQSGYKGF